MTKRPRTPWDDGRKEEEETGTHGLYIRSTPPDDVMSRRWRGKTPQSEPGTPGVKGDCETHGFHSFVFYIVNFTRVVKVWRGETGRTWLTKSSLIKNWKRHHVCLKQKVSRYFLHLTQKSCWTCHTVTWQLIEMLLSLIGWGSQWTRMLVEKLQTGSVQQVRSLRTLCQKKEKKNRRGENKSKVENKLKKKAQKNNLKRHRKKKSYRRDGSIWQLPLTSGTSHMPGFNIFSVFIWLKLFARSSVTHTTWTEAGIRRSPTWAWVLVCLGDNGGSGLGWKVHSAGPAVDRKGELLLNWCLSHGKEAISVLIHNFNFQLMETSPTIGFNVGNLDLNKNTSLTVWDVGGQKSMRPNWR